ncbi:hypothetical protein ACJZ2D_014430 [Fusarium nematophilum]
MEAWKFTPEDLHLYPVAALNVTAKRWRLQPFPDNLVGIEGSQNSNDTNHAWPHDQIVYPCGNSLCYWPQPCENFSCAIVIEGIGATRAGPAHSDIIGLTHGIIILLIVLTTTALITAVLVMGCCSSVPYSPPPSRGCSDQRERTRPGEELVRLETRLLRHPRPSALERDRLVNRYYVAPQRLATQRPVEISWAVAKLPSRSSSSDDRQCDGRNQAEETRQKARQIERCMTLLREMFALDLRAWSMEEVALREGDRSERVRLWERVECIFHEVVDVVSSWRNEAIRGTSGSNYWSDDEGRVVEAIYKAIDEHLQGRHVDSTASGDEDVLQTEKPIP